MVQQQKKTCHHIFHTRFKMHCAEQLLTTWPDSCNDFHINLLNFPIKYTLSRWNETNKFSVHTFKRKERQCDFFADLDLLYLLEI